MTPDEIREIVRQELANRPINHAPAHWTKVRRELDGVLESVPVQKLRNALQSAFYTFVKTRYGIRHINQISEEQADDAMALIPSFVELAGIKTNV